MVDRQFTHLSPTGPPGFNSNSIIAPDNKNTSLILNPNLLLGNNKDGMVLEAQPKWVEPDLLDSQSKPEGTKLKINDNLSTVQRVVLCASEFGGTAILVFLGCMGCVTGIAEEPIPHEQISLTFGLAVMVAIQIFGHVSGSHINPIVTVAAATLGTIPLVQVPIYFVGQFLGALAGFGLLKAVTPIEFMNSTSEGVCSPAMNPSLTPTQGLLVEFIISLILTLACCGVWDQRNSTKLDSAAIRIGFTIAVLSFAAGPYTGSNMNPVRSFAPALINGDWENHWIYWIGPLSGGFVGAHLYRVIFAITVTPVQYLNSTTVGVCSPVINPSLTPTQGLLVEFIISLILTLVCCGVWDHRNNTKHDSTAIRLGFTIAVLVLAAGPYTGSNMNPVRSFAPALFNGYWENHWVYWVAPLSAGFAGALLYRVIFAIAAPPQKSHNDISKEIAIQDIA